MKTDDGGFRDKDWMYTWYDGSTVDPGGITVICGNTLGGNNCNTLNYVNAVNAAGLCGYPSGWGLPTTRELFSIVHNGTWNPAIDVNYFPNTVSHWYWSADTYVPDPAFAWDVNFGPGGAGAAPKVNGFHVRLVRSGQ